MSLLVLPGLDTISFSRIIDTPQLLVLVAMFIHLVIVATSTSTTKSKTSSTSTSRSSGAFPGTARNSFVFLLVPVEGAAPPGFDLEENHLFLVISRPAEKPEKAQYELSLVHPCR